MTKLRETADNAAKAAQQARSKKYHIAIKDGGSVTKPGEWKGLPDSAWGDPVNYSYPMPDKSHADNAASRWGDTSNRAVYSDAEQVIIGKRIAARQAHFGEKKESQESAAGGDGTRPKKKIGTLPICWLEYNARSLNGRIYPKATCDRIYQAALRDVANRELPPTTFVSHEDANGNVNTHLVGGPTKVWQEGAKFWANIDLADTSVSWDMLGLAEGGYLKSGSMRVLGVEQMHDRNYDLPLVVIPEGVDPQFLGIDLTTRPGLVDVARIPHVLYESDGRAPYIDTFSLTDVHIETSQEGPMPIPIFMKVLLGELQEARTSEAKQAHQRIHDNLAGVLDATIGAKHGSESARLIALVEGELSEEGKAIAQKHAVKIAAAHDEAAKQCGMECAGCYNDALGIDPNSDDDGDGIPDDLDPQDDGEESARQKGTKQLTEEQKLIVALKAKGYTIEAPKSADERLADMERKLKEQQEAFDAKLKALSESQETPQRKTAALSQMSEQQQKLSPETLYESGDYLKGTLTPANWKALSDPRVPWPEDLDPDTAIFELAPYLNYRLLAMQEAAQGHDLRGMVVAGVYD